MHFSAQRAYELLTDLADIGRRPPGSAAHERCVAWMEAALRRQGLEPERQRWEVALSLVPSGRVTLTNLVVRIPGREPGPTTLLGTHWDSRWIADNEPDPARRLEPIPGVNDGGSGTVILLELARVLTKHPPKHDVTMAFFDGEDLGHIEGHPFAVGSRHFVAQGAPWIPDQAIILDMVGGEGCRLNIEVNSLSTTAAAAELFIQLFRIGRGLALPSFFGGSTRAIQCDHTPFQEAAIPAVVLIDIDYPWWHTQDDTLEHCSAQPLGEVGVVLERHLDSQAPTGESKEQP